jgi:hypothetical protein
VDVGGVRLGGGLEEEAGGAGAFAGALESVGGLAAGVDEGDVLL